MPEPPADAGPPEQPAPPDRDPATPMSDPAKPAGRSTRRAPRARRRWDRYDYIGAAIVAFLAALWVAHFSLSEAGGWLSGRRIFRCRVFPPTISLRQTSLPGPTEHGVTAVYCGALKHSGVTRGER